MYSPELIKSVFLKKGYKYFSQGQFNLNIIGIRSECSKSNEFDDKMIISYINQDKQEVMNVHPVTTDPGKSYLLNPLKGTKGALVMVPGQYLHAYCIGIHGMSRPKAKQYQALVQTAPLCYVRDCDKNDVIDFDLYRGTNAKANMFWANAKSNIHRGNPGWLSKIKGQHLVDNYSAGCQVFEYEDNFEELMTLARKSAIMWGNSFSYTLLEESDFSPAVK